MTEAELKLWNELRAHRLMALGFRRQVPIAGFIVDFACAAKRLIVELDGTHHGDAAQVLADELRSQRLRQDGWTVLRFWNDDLLRDIDGVCRHIVAVAGLAAADAETQAAHHPDGPPLCLANDPTRPLRGHPPRDGEGSRASSARDPEGPPLRADEFATPTPTPPKELHP